MFLDMQKNALGCLADRRFLQCTLKISAPRPFQEVGELRNLAGN